MANAGPSQTVTELSPVTLDGTGSSDPDPGSTLQYQWTHVYGPPVLLLSGATTAQPTFTAPEVTGGATLVFELRVRDDELQESTAFVLIHVQDAPGAPVANAGPDQRAAEGAQVTLDGTGSSDPDATDVLTFQWTQTMGQSVTLTGAQTAQPSFTVPYNRFNDRLAFQLTVSDGVYSSTDTVEILVVHPDPVPVANAGLDQTVAEGTVVTLNALGSHDPWGYSIRQYAWNQIAGPSVTLIPTQTRPQPQFVSPDVTVPTVLTFQLTVWNNLFLSSTDTVNITVTPL